MRCILAAASAVCVPMLVESHASSLCNLTGNWSSGWSSNYSGGSAGIPKVSKFSSLEVSPAVTPFGNPPAQYMVQDWNQALALHPDMKTCFGNGTCQADQFGLARSLNSSSPECTFIAWPESETRHVRGGGWCKVPFCPAGPPPHPPPPQFPLFNVSWPPTYDMQRSTISNPTGNQTGLDQGALLEQDAKYGIIVFDGGDMGCLHYRKGPADDPCKYATTFADAEAQARAVKALDNTTHVFSYINMLLVLTRNEFDCPLLHDPAYRGFLLTNYSSGQPVQKPPKPEGKGCESVAPPPAYEDLYLYFLDWTNETARNWWLDVKLQAFIDSPVIDGFYWDDPVFGNEAEWIRDYFPPDQLAEIDAAMAAVRLEGFKRLSANGMFCVGSTCPTGLQPPMNCQCTTHTNCTCDFRAAVVENNLREAAAKNASPGLMYVNYPVPTFDVQVSCAGPAVVQPQRTDPTLTPTIVQLSCLPGTGTLTVEFASFGLPAVRSNTSNASVPPDCTAFEANPGCDAGPAVLQRLAELCNGKQSCRINTSDPVFTPPAPGTNASQACGKLKVGEGNGEGDGPGARERDGKDGLLRLAVRASGCAQGTGGGQRAWFRETLAGFLLTRGPHSWMGHNWIGFAHPTWYPEWSLDYGIPTGEMNFTTNGTVAFREWSKMRVELDVGPPFEARFLPTNTTTNTARHNSSVTNE